ncbi:unnamed protein product, partial [Laminaria digitata]
MVNVRTKRCSYDSCRKIPSFGVDGSKTAVYCKQHSVDGMVSVRHKPCTNNSCRKHATFNVEGTKTPVYCQQHAEEGMVNVRTRPSLQDRPTTKPARGAPTNAATMAPTR